MAENMITPGGNPVCEKCGCWFLGPVKLHLCARTQETYQWGVQRDTGEVTSWPEGWGEKEGEEWAHAFARLKNRTVVRRKIVRTTTVSDWEDASDE